MEIEATGTGGRFLSTQPAGRGARRLALWVLVVSILIFGAAVPFSKVQLAPVFAFIPVYESALIINDLITAVLLLGQFAFLQSRALLVLAGGYLFTAFTAIAHALTFPGLFSATGLLGAGPQSTAWLYMFWHGGFPLFVIAYALLKHTPRDAHRPGSRFWVAAVVGAGAVLAAACGLTLLATAGQDALPAIMQGNRYTPAMIGVVSSVWLLSLVAAAVLWLRRPHTFLDLCLIVVMCAWLFDIALSAVLNAGRFDLGFYAGRLYGLVASGIVLVTMLIEYGLLYARLATAYESESQEHHRAQERAYRELQASQARLQASEEEYRLLFQGNPHAMWVFDPDTLRFLDANATATMVYGYSREEFLGMTLRDIRPPEELPGLELTLKTLQATDWAPKERVQRKHRKKDGTVFDVETASNNVDFGGRRVRLLMAVDMTERERARLALEQSERRFHDFAASASDIFWEADGSLRVNLVQHGTGSQSGETLLIDGAPAHRFPELQRDDPIWEAFRRLLEQRQPFKDFILPLTTPLGNNRIFRVNGIPHSDESGTFLGYRGTATDMTAEVTARHRADDAYAGMLSAEEATRAAEEANRTKSAFLANMSHELRTPLNAILGYSELILDELKQDQRANVAGDVAKIRTAGSHLLGLINDILDLSKIEAGRMDQYVERFDLSQTLDEIASTALPLVDKNNNTLHLSYPPDLGPFISDQTKFKQILLNLLSNAAKFTKEGGIRLEAKIGQRDTGRMLEISVSDTGIGITPEQLDKLFQPFTQADASTTRKYGGTGLGLAITKVYCQMLGGSIEVESQIEQGTTFRVLLPFDHFPAPEAPVSNLEKEPVSAAPPAEDSGGTRPVALVIDDDPTAQRLLRHQLENAGYGVHTAGTGEEGIAQARKIMPALITLDVLMPGMDGWQVMSAIRSDPQLAEIPVVIVSIVNERGRGFHLGASDYLIKPIDSSRFQAVLRRYRSQAARRALLIEADANARRLMKHLLAQDGWEVLESGDHADALRTLEQNEIQIIITGLVSEANSTLMFIDEVKRRADWANVPILVVAAENLTAVDRQQLNSRVADVLEEQRWSVEELLGQVRELTRSAAR